MHLRLVFITCSTWSIRALLVLSIVAMTSAGTAQAQTGSAPASGIGGMARKLNPMNWKMPKPNFRLPNFLVQNQDQDRIVERKNSLLTDVRMTASRSWQRTKETFSPAKLNPMNLFAGGNNAPAPTTQSSPGFFQNMFSTPPEPPEDRVANVTDFLGQQRPK